MQEEKVVYLVDGKIEVSELREFCDGVCYKEFGRPAYDWELGKDLPTTDKVLNKKLIDRFKKAKNGYYLTIRPMKVVS